MASVYCKSEDGRTPLLSTARSSCPWESISAKCSSLFGLVTKRNLALVSGPLATLASHFLYKSFVHSSSVDPGSDNVGSMLGILFWMAFWWVLAPIPLAMTSLLPLVLFPFLGIMNSEEVSAQYINSVVVLLIGTFILALSIQKYNLHKRVALKILLTAGGKEMNPRNVLLGFLIASFFVSMWMSDTVAAVMMLPVSVGVLNNLSETKPIGTARAFEDSPNLTDAERGTASQRGASQECSAKLLPNDDDLAAKAVAEFGKGLLLATTYAVALGGMSTLIGSGPNVILPGFYAKTLRAGRPLTFLTWWQFALPMLLPHLLLLWLYLDWYFCPPWVAASIKTRLNRRMVEADYEALGPMSFAETVIITEYLILVVLWITRIFGTTPGWGAVFNNFPSDGTVAVFAAITLFIIPNRQKAGEMIMDWTICKDMSWNVILLVGGGFALSKGIRVSGLAELIGVKMQVLEMVPYYLVTPVIIAILSIVTEFASNVSVASLFLPLLADVADSTNINPLLLLVPATFACNFSYNLPSATPPNAIALASGHLKVKDMAYPGLFMHLVGLLLMSIFIPSLGAYVFGLNSND